MSESPSLRAVESCSNVVVSQGPTSSNRTKSGGSSSKPSLIDSYVPQRLTYKDCHYQPGTSDTTVATTPPSAFAFTSSFSMGKTVQGVLTNSEIIVCTFPRLLLAILLQNNRMNPVVILTARLITSRSSLPTSQPAVKEDQLSLSRSNSARRHEREHLEHDLPHDTIEGRQGPNHSLSLSLPVRYPPPTILLPSTPCTTPRLCIMYCTK
ncbi:hypothetical protein JOM56_013694 [Amanita muscaria]